LEGARNLKSYLKVDIPVYIPKNREKFIQDYRIRNFSQTVLIDEKGKVKWVKANELNADDYFKLKELVFKIRRRLKNGQKISNNYYPINGYIFKYWVLDFNS